MQPNVTIIVCTYNRADLLRPALESLVRQSVEKSTYEIVIVDNASQDGTAAVMKEFQQSHSSPNIVLAYEPTKGLGHARNTGCKVADGRYLAFIDDDCIAAEDWLANLIDCYEHVQPQPWSVGGIVLPKYAEPIPAWFKDSYETDTWGDDARFLTHGESFTGCNMSFRNEVIQRFGGFDATFGMRGEQLALGEDTQLYRKMWTIAGKACTFYFTPRAIVYHTIEPYKMTVLYQLKRAISSGQASSALCRSGRMSGRWVLCIGSIGLILWYGCKALNPIKHGYWQRWAIESLYPVACQVGKVLGIFGIKLTFRQRKAISSVF